MKFPEGGEFHAIDAPESRHYAMAVVVTRLSHEVEGSASTKQLQANARLIAAAPDLLEALIALMGNDFISLGDIIYRVRDIEGLGWDGPGVKAWGTAVDCAFNAIAKATGETS